MQYDEELARMRAQMLADRDEEPPIFDDGARYLGQDPNMMPVAWFGRPKKPAAPPSAPPVNLQRRSILGLTPMPADLPAVIPPTTPKPTPQQIEQAVPQQQPSSAAPSSAPSTAPSVSPLQSLADKTLNAPISRREVLKKAGQAALQQVLPTPSISDVVPQVMSPLTEVVQNRFVSVPGIDTYIHDYVSNGFSEGLASEPFAVTTSMYEFMRDYLNDRVPQKELNKFDKLNARVERYYENDDEYSDRATSAQDAVADFLFDKMKLLKPHELLDVSENFNQEMLSPEDFYNNILESRGGEGLESLGAEGFAKYLEVSEKSPKPVIQEAPKPAPKAKSKSKGK